MDKSYSVKKYLFVFFIILVTFPTLQGWFKLLKVTGLYGVDFPIEKVDFNLTSWSDGSFQQYLDDLSRDKIGFKPYLVRLSNQISFSIFKDLKPKGVIIGKEHYLFEKGYVSNAKGLALIDRDSLREMTRGLVILNDYLNARQKKLMVVIAPNKARFYPNYLPGKPRFFPKKSNYYLTKKIFTRKNLPIFDCIEYFEKIRNTEPYPLITKCGTHWSIYGSVRVADTLMKTMEKSFSWPIEKYSIDTIEVTTKHRHTDSDLNMLLNLMFDIPSDTMAYPHLVGNSTGKKLKVLGIGDSFYLSFLQNGWAETCFDPNSLLFFYYNTTYVGTEKIEKLAKDYDFKEIIDNSDVVLLCATEPNIYRTFGKFSADCITYLSQE